MIRPVGNNAVLPANRAFVVQFSRDNGDGGSRYGGRIEHIESGRVEIFYSREEMCDKIKVLLDLISSDSKT